MRITVIGDLHGTPHNLITILKEFQYIDAELNWKEPDLFLVILGDCCDRGYNSYDIYRLLMQWQNQAPDVNSELLFIIGNHEVMNIFGYSSYNTIEEYESFAGESEFRRAFSEGGWVREWVVNQSAVIKLDSFIFGHGDLPSALSNRLCTEIDARVKSALISFPAPGSEQFPAPLFSSDESILWCRQAQYDRVRHYGEALKNFLLINDAEIYICGHTPSRDGRFKLLYDNRYLCVDTGMVFTSMGLGSVSALKIEGPRLTACYFYDCKFSETELLTLS